MIQLPALCFGSQRIYLDVGASQFAERLKVIVEHTDPTTTISVKRIRGSNGKPGKRRPTHRRRNDYLRITLKGVKEDGWKNSALSMLKDWYPGCVWLRPGPEV